MKLFYQQTKSKVEKQIYLKEVNEDDEGYLVVKLLESKYETKMTYYLEVIKSELSLDGIKKPAFTYTYDNDSTTYTITPINANALKIIEEFESNNLLVPEPKPTPSK